MAGLFDDLMGRVAGRFGRVEPRRRARALVLGLLAELPRKNCWSIAEQAGDAAPDGMQHLLARARWDADGVPQRATRYQHDQDWPAADASVRGRADAVTAVTAPGQGVTRPMACRPWA